MEYLETPLTPADLKWCEEWLETYTNIVQCLTNRVEFTEYTIGKLIQYEAMHEQRMELMIRLTARYNKLRRQREWARLLKFIGDYNAITETERERHRKVLMHES